MKDTDQTAVMAIIRFSSGYRLSLHGEGLDMQCKMGCLTFKKLHDDTDIEGKAFLDALMDMHIIALRLFDSALSGHAVTVILLDRFLVIRCTLAKLP